MNESNLDLSQAKPEKVMFTAPYGRDNMVNIHGDYDTLRITFTRLGPTDTDPQHDIELLGEKSTAVLNDEESAAVLLNFFLQKATRVAS